MKPTSGAPKNPYSSYQKPVNHQITRIFISTNPRCRPDLASDILRTIHLREKKAQQIRLYGYIAIATISTIGIVPAISIVIHQSSQSGLYQYLSLAFSDTGTLAGYWKQFGLVLVESIPMVSIALVLGITFVLGWSLKKAIRERSQFIIIR